MNLCIKTKHFITIRLKKPNENTTTLQVQMFLLIFTDFLFFDIDKKRQFMRKHKILKYMFTVYFLQ